MRDALKIPAINKIRQYRSLNIRGTLSKPTWFYSKLRRQALRFQDLHWKDNKNI